MPPSRNQSHMLSCFSLGHFCNDFAPCAIWIIGPAVALSMDLSPAELGLLFTIHAVGAALAFFPAGVVSDHISDRGRLLLMTFVWVAVGYFVASYAPNYWTLALLLAVAGIGDAVWHPVATGVLVQHFPATKAKVLGIHAMGGTFADVLGPLAAGFLLVHLDWQSTLQICAIPAAIMALVFIPIAKSVPKRQRQRISRDDFLGLWQTWTSKAGMRVVFLIGFYNMALMALLSMVPLYLQRVHELDISVTGALYSVMILAGALLQPVIGGLSDRLGRRLVAICGTVLAALASAILFVASGLYFIVTLQIIATGTLIAIRSVLLAVAVEHADKKESTTLGLAFTVMDGIGALGALAAGAAGSFRLEYAFLLAAGLSLLASLLALRLSPARQREAAA